MQSLSLQGPWAHYEKVNRSQQVEIFELNKQLEAWQSKYQAKCLALDEECRQRQQLEHSRVPELENRLATASNLIDDLQTQVSKGKEQLQDAEQVAAAAVAALQSKLETAAADIAVLKSELAKAVQLRSVTHAKVEAAKKHLGLNQPEAEFFIQELDELRATSKSLKAQVASLTADKARLEQQCDSRAAHALTLISENKRLLEQVSDLRRQMVAADQDLWRLRQDLAVAQRAGAKSAARKAQPKVARPEWQLGPRQASASGGGSASSGQPGLQDITNNQSGGGSGGPGAKGFKPVHHDKAWNSNPKQGSHQASRTLAELYQVVGSGTATDGACVVGSGAGAGQAGAGEARAKENAVGQEGQVAAGVQSRQRGSATAKRAPPPSSVAQAVQDAAAQLEELRRSALQQALATRQQRLSTHAAAG